MALIYVILATYYAPLKIKFEFKLKSDFHSCKFVGLQPHTYCYLNCFMFYMTVLVL